MCVLEPILLNDSKPVSSIPRTLPNRTTVLRRLRLYCLMRSAYRQAIVLSLVVLLALGGWGIVKAFFALQGYLITLYVRKIFPSLILSWVHDDDWIWWLHFFLDIVVRWSLSIPLILVAGRLFFLEEFKSFWGQEPNSKKWRVCILVTSLPTNFPQRTFSAALYDGLAILLTVWSVFGVFQVPSLVRYALGREEDCHNDGKVAAGDQAPVTATDVHDHGIRPTEELALPCPKAITSAVSTLVRPPDADDETWEAIQLAAANGDAENVSRASAAAPPPSITAVLSPPRGFSTTMAPATTAIGDACASERPKGLSKRWDGVGSAPAPTYVFPDAQAPTTVKEFIQRHSPYAAFAFEQAVLTLFNMVIAVPAMALACAPWRWTKVPCAIAAHSRESLWRGGALCHAVFRLSPVSLPRHSRSLGFCCADCAKAAPLHRACRASPCRAAAGLQRDF